jgi:ribosome biogenesis GTPase
MPHSTVNLKTLGWDASWEESFAPWQTRGCEPGRVVAEDKLHYSVVTRQGEMLGQVSGKLFHHQRSNAALPKVGDWVALKLYPAEQKAVIQHVLPRQSKLSRKVAGRVNDEQILAVNLHTAFIVQALDESFSVRFIERLLLMVREGGSRPVVVLNKCDVLADPSAQVAEAQKAAQDAPTLVVSAKTGRGMPLLRRELHAGKTSVFIGSSGVGKSSLINRLYGEEIQPTTEVREHDYKGRHTTSWREMVLLPNGSLVIDTPGMREFHLWFAGLGVTESFEDIEGVAALCQFANCSHVSEKACAVQAAVAAGTLAPERVASYLKLKHEIQYLEKARRLRKKSSGRYRPTIAHHDSWDD